MRFVDFFTQIINMSITATAVALCLAVLRVLFRKQISAGFKYLMWSLVFIRLLLPVSIPSVFSLFNLFSVGRAESVDDYAVRIEYVQWDSNYIPLEEDHFNVYATLTILWLGVFVLLMSWQLILLLQTQRRLAAAQPLELPHLMEECQHRTKLNRKPRLYCSSLFDTPVVVGVFRPHIILPVCMDMENEEQLRHILLHEMVHVRRMDHISKLIMTLALYLHWFNPVVWRCYKDCLDDIETSCDQWVLSILEPGEQTHYASTLVEFCSQQKNHFSQVMLSFAEQRSLLRTRVMAALDYHPQHPLKRALLLVLIILVGIMTNTNPVPSYEGYIPSSVDLPKETMASYENAARQLCDALAQGGADALLSLSVYDDEYYESLYETIPPMEISHYRLYPQSEDMAYVYLRSGKVELVAQFERYEEDILLTALRQEAIFARCMMQEESEARRFVENLHRFGVLRVEQEKSDSSIAALCVDEEYRDRVKSGDLQEGNYYIPEEWVKDAALRYFGLEDFSYTGDEELYDAQKHCYIYDPLREDPANAEVLLCQETEEKVEVVSVLFSDPLQLYPQARVSYSLTNQGERG